MVDLDDDVEDLSIEELEQMVESLEAKKKLVAKQLKGKLAAAKAHAAKAERTKFWVPVDEDELYYYVVYHLLRHIVELCLPRVKSFESSLSTEMTTLASPLGGWVY